MFVNGTRTGSRIPLELPVQIRWKDVAGEEHVVEAVTRNISGNGMLIDGSVPLSHDMQFTFRVALPPDATPVPLELDGHARVVRRPGDPSVNGVGAIIDDYRIRPSRLSD